MPPEDFLTKHTKKKMLYATGTINGETYNETPIDPQVIIDAGLVQPLTGVIEFRISDTRKKVDPFGQKNISIATLIPTKTDVNVRSKGLNASFTLRYAEGRNILPNGGYEYHPHRLSDFQGEALAFDDESSLDKYVFYSLFRSNASSPGFKPGSSALYYRYDRDAEALKQNAILQMQNTINGEIFTMDETNLRIRAGGLNYRSLLGGVTTIDNTLTVAELRNHLSMMLNRDGVTFMNAWNDKAGALRGMLRVAVDKGLIILKANAAGGNTYYWDEGAEITMISGSEDAELRLLTEFSNRYTELLPILTAALNREQRLAVVLPEVSEKVLTVDETASSELYKLKIEDLIDLAMRRGVLSFNYETSSVMLVDEHGDLTDNVLYESPSKKEWQKNLTTAFKNPSYAPQKKLMIGVITKLATQPQE